jgi:hypothetical protein
MHVLNGNFVNRKLVLDDPVPDDIRDNVKIRVTIEPAGPSKALAAIAKMAISAPELPADYSSNHDKYLYGIREP